MALAALVAALPMSMPHEPWSIAITFITSTRPPLAFAVDSNTNLIAMDE